MTTAKIINMETKEASKFIKLLKEALINANLDGT